MTMVTQAFNNAANDNDAIDGEVKVEKDLFRAVTERDHRSSHANSNASPAAATMQAAAKTAMRAIVAPGTRLSTSSRKTRQGASRLKTNWATGRGRSPKLAESQ